MRSIGATVRRFRPIVLTASAAVLALIPLTRSDFFGPMAVAMMGGLVDRDSIDVLFLPALYAAWFRVERNPRAVAMSGCRRPAARRRQAAGAAGRGIIGRIQPGALR